VDSSQDSTIDNPPVDLATYIGKGALRSSLSRTLLRFRMAMTCRIALARFIAIVFGAARSMEHV
jgi:hypothetical protein